MYNKAVLKEQAQEELHWVKYRMNMLDIIENKLFEMKKIAEIARGDNLTPVELEMLNAEINKLAEQVRALDEESRRIEDKNSATIM